MTSRPYTPIDCGLHDHLELACLRAYRLRIAAGSGQLEGVAVTTRSDADGSEWLVIDRDGEALCVRLDEIRSIEALDDAAEFRRVDFGAQGSRNRSSR